MTDIEEVGFIYDNVNEKVKCTVCISDDDQKLNNQNPGVFIYSLADGLDFTKTDKLPRNFINLKKSLKRHILESQVHCSILKKEKERHEADLALTAKNREAGINIGRIAMKNYLQGRPSMDFENDI